MAKKGTRKYNGRLAFDPDTGFHLSEDGKKVVTDDEGRTWRFATDDDPSHIARYQRRELTIDTTANAENPEPHHLEVQPDDPHFNGLLADPDVEAEKITSHTAAWK